MEDYSFADALEDLLELEGETGPLNAEERTAAAARVRRFITAIEQGGFVMDTSGE